jgi:hypothetical protein
MTRGPLMSGCQFSGSAATRIVRSTGTGSSGRSGAATRSVRRGEATRLQHLGDSVAGRLRLECADDADDHLWRLAHHAPNAAPSMSPTASKIDEHRIGSSRY